MTGAGLIYEGIIIIGDRRSARGGPEAILPGDKGSSAHLRLDVFVPMVIPRSPRSQNDLDDNVRDAEAVVCV